MASRALCLPWSHLPHPGSLSGSPRRCLPVHLLEGWRICKFIIGLCDFSPRLKSRILSLWLQRLENLWKLTFYFSSHEITKSNIINLSPQTLFEILSSNPKYLLSIFKMSKLSYMSLAIASGNTFLGGNSNILMLHLI